MNNCSFYLNDYVSQVICEHGLDVVIQNYIAIREDYYNQKQ